jgi:hypothetical protein
MTSFTSFLYVVTIVQIISNNNSFYPWDNIGFALPTCFEWRLRARKRIILKIASATRAPHIFSAISSDIIKEWRTIFNQVHSADIAPDKRE